MPGPDLTVEPSASMQLLGAWVARSPRVMAYKRRARNAHDVESVLQGAHPRGVIARGAGHSLGDAAQRAGGLVVDTTAMSRILSFDADAGVVTAEAGVPLGELMRIAVPHGWLPAVLPTTAYVTVGGALAADIHGRNQHRDGSFADHVSSFRLLTPSGELMVTPEGEPELFAATAGGMGLTGVILEATIHLTAIETGRVLVRTEHARDLDDLMAKLDQGDSARYSAAWLDALSSGRKLGRGVIVRGEHASRADLAGMGADEALAFTPSRGVSIPRRLPPLLRGARMVAVNELIYRGTTERERVQTLGGFFHVHDRVQSWFSFCGSPGFVEYQFAVPASRVEAIRSAIERASQGEVEPFFAVLKRFGSSASRPLSFPMPGWMLALDFRAGPGLAALLLDLDEIVAAAGGRVYLAKDARLRPESLAAMYPDLEALSSVRDRHDPERIMCSDLSARLEI